MNLKSKFRRFITWPDLLAVGMGGGVVLLAGGFCGGG